MVQPGRLPPIPAPLRYFFLFWPHREFPGQGSDRSCSCSLHRRCGTAGGGGGGGVEPASQRSQDNADSIAPQRELHPFRVFCTTASCTRTAKASGVSTAARGGYGARLPPATCSLCPPVGSLHSWHFVPQRVQEEWTQPTSAWLWNPHVHSAHGRRRPALRWPLANSSLP